MTEKKKKKFYEERTTITFGFDSQSIEIVALVIGGVDLEYLLSQPVMKLGRKLTSTGTVKSQLRK